MAYGDRGRLRRSLDLICTIIAKHICERETLRNNIISKCFDYLGVAFAFERILNMFKRFPMLYELIRHNSCLIYTYSVFTYFIVILYSIFYVAEIIP